MLQLSVQQARDLHLAAQGLSKPHAPGAAKADVLAAIKRMGALQIDTISVVARSPYLVLWSRLGSYEPRWLDELLDEGKLFEYWSHAACFLPIEAYRQYRREMLDGRPRARAWLAENRELAERVLSRVRDGGEVRSAHFERTDGGGSGWWDWKPEKHALEVLFSTGELMIARREGFQRVYDLRERVHPNWDDAQGLSPEDARREKVLQTVRALGITKAKWIPNYFAMRAQGMAPLMQSLMADEYIIPVTVVGWDVPGYVHPENLSLAEAAAAGELNSTVTTLLSPFDPVMWDRVRALELFDFHYRIETYTPAPKRRYGYFTLPILHCGRIVGRLDPKAHRKEGRFEVRALHLEPGVRVTRALASALRTTLTACATWHGTPNVEITRSDPPELRGAILS